MLACRCLLEGDHSSTSLLLLVALEETLLWLDEAESELSCLILLAFCWESEFLLTLFVASSFLQSDIFICLAFGCVILLWESSGWPSSLSSFVINSILIFFVALDGA